MPGSFVTAAGVDIADANVTGAVHDLSLPHDVGGGRESDRNHLQVVASDFFDLDVRKWSAAVRMPGQRQASVAHDSTHGDRRITAMRTVVGGIIFDKAGTG